ncbi:MAG: beta-lactamase family protein [Acidobacteria bacterium]|nr:beta-lactamase family protein [Acidobacteriota bacterium]
MKNTTAASLLFALASIVHGHLGARLDTYMTRLAGVGFSGTILVAKDGDVVLSKGYGLADRKRGIPDTEETVISIGSITKQFTAAAILRLEMQGKLKVTDPISKYLPGVPPDKSAITIHHLLTHTAGVDSDYGDSDYEPVSRDEIMKRIWAKPLRSEPGKVHFYANAGYSLLAAIIEIVTGGSYELYLHDNLFIPAGMTKTGYLLPKWDKDAVAIGYRRGEEWGTILARPFAADGPYWNLRGNGGIHSTVGDMYRWHLALLGETILSKEEKEKLFTPYVPEEGGGSFYGYGWSIETTPRGTKLVAHNGGNGVFAADFRRYLDENTMYYIASNGDIPAIPVSERIARQIFGGDVPPPPEVKTLTRAALERCAGTYALASGAKITVSAGADNSLKIASDEPEARGLLAGNASESDPIVRKLIERTAAVVKASREGDYKVVSDAFGGQVPVERVKAMESQMWARNESRLGSYQGFDVLGAAADGGEIRPIVVRIRFERGPMFIQYMWDGPELAGIRIVDQLPSAAFFPVSQTEFVSFALDSPASVRVTFPAPPSAQADTLVIRTATGDVRAARR